jgi:hypothetical protein
MQDINDVKTPANVDRIVARATASARAKNDRLKKMKERNELYLANKRAELGTEDDDDFEDEVTREL